MVVWWGIAEHIAVEGRVDWMEAVLAGGDKAGKSEISAQEGMVFADCSNCLVHHLTVICHLVELADPAQD